MKIVGVELKPLAPKHYHTEIDVTVADASGYRYTIGVDVYGYFPAPSQRELDGGWDIEYGMDHVETHAEYAIALAIVEALKEKGMGW